MIEITGTIPPMVLWSKNGEWIHTYQFEANHDDTQIFMTCCFKVESGTLLELLRIETLRVSEDEDGWGKYKPYSLLDPSSKEIVDALEAAYAKIHPKGTRENLVENSPDLNIVMPSVKRSAVDGTLPYTLVLPSGRKQTVRLEKPPVPHMPLYVQGHVCNVWYTLERIDDEQRELHVQFFKAVDINFANEPKS